MLPPSHSRHHALSDDQIQILMRLDPHNLLHAMFQFDLCLGLRPPELLGLVWNKVHLHEMTVRVDQQLSIRKKGLSIEIRPFTKNRKPRVLRFGSFVEELLSIVRETQDELRTAAGENWCDPYGLVFCHELGQPFSESEADTELFRLLANTSNPDVRLYNLRHTAATVVHYETGEVRPAQLLLGHASPEVTRKYYIDRDTRSKRIIANATNKYTKGILDNAT